jgi:hypothetical protein
MMIRRAFLAALAALVAPKPIPKATPVLPALPLVLPRVVFTHYDFELPFSDEEFDRIFDETDPRGACLRLHVFDAVATMHLDRSIEAGLEPLLGPNDDVLT